VLRLIRAAALAAAFVPATLSAHAGEHADSETIGWSLEPQIVLPLVAIMALYAAGWLRLAQRSRRGGRRLRRKGLVFVCGWLVLAGALLSPLHQGGEVSFTLHMIEHELIMLPAALLLVAARPGPVLLWGLPRGTRRLLRPLIAAQLWRALAGPITAMAVQGVVMIVWHVPALFDLALRHDGWHIVQHACFVGSALMFWWAMLASEDRPGGALVAAACLFATSMLGGGLGALMTLGSSPWYDAYARLGATPFGLSPVEDQQLAGLIMWVPGGLFHLAAALAFVARAVRLAPERLDKGVSRGGQAA